MPNILPATRCFVFAGCLLAVSVYGQVASSPAATIARAQRAVLGSTKLDSLVLEGGILAEVNARTGEVIPRPAPIEIRVLLPNNYLRTDEWSGGLRQRGFSDMEPLSAVTPPNPGAEVRHPPVGAAGLAALRATAARLMLGIAGVLDGPLALKAGSGATSTNLHITGPDGFDCRLDVAAGSGMPLRVRYEGAVFFYTPPTSGQQQAVQRTEKAELTLAFEDRRSVGGIQVPHHITLTARSLTNGQTYVQEDIRVERALVNSLTKADFKVK